MYSRASVVLTTDTGANDTQFFAPINGTLVQVAYKSVDTGVRVDTGAEITLTADTGRLNMILSSFHVVPNGTAWAKAFNVPIMDTGGDALANVSAGVVLAGEKVKASIQGLATDTGKEVTLFLYTGLNG